MRRRSRCCCEGYADFMMVHHCRGCAGSRDMLEKLARIPKRIVMSEAPGREGVRSGRQAVLGAVIMKKRTWCWARSWCWWQQVLSSRRSGGTCGQAAPSRRRRARAPAAVPVEIATATKRTVPVRIEALGSVTPIASVAIKARIDSEIVGGALSRWRDGAGGRPLVHARQPRAAGTDQAGARVARGSEGPARAGRT